MCILPLQRPKFVYSSVCWDSLLVGLYRSILWGGGESHHGFTSLCNGVCSHLLFFSFSRAVIQRTSTAINLLFSHLHFDGREWFKQSRKILYIPTRYIISVLYVLISSFVVCMIIRQQANSQCHKTALKSFMSAVLQHWLIYAWCAPPVEAQSRLRSLTLTNSLRNTIWHLGDCWEF